MIEIRILGRKKSKTTIDMNTINFMRTAFIAGLIGLASSAAQAQTTEKNDLMTDTWVATDGIGRVTPTSEEAPLKLGKDRTVGIFYVTWHGRDSHNGKPYRNDISKVFAQDPDANINDDSPAWPGYVSYHWGEPEYGYFISDDEYVIRHDMSMLADAGVDMIILDVTNAVRYWHEWEVIFQTMEKMKAEGNKVPQFCFWAFNGPVIDVVQNLYEVYYKNPKYQDLWFYWDGKPLLLYNATPDVDANPNGGQQDIKDYSPEVKSFFTLRNMWWGYYEWNGERFLGTEDNWSFGQQLENRRVAALSPEDRTSRHNGRLEEFSVTPAQHPNADKGVGKSWSIKTGEPKLGKGDMPEKAYVPYLGEVKENPTQYGIYFQERWDEALQVDPEFIYLNDWNEWTAGKYRNGKDPSGQADYRIDFLGRKDSKYYFVDQYNAEFNRTISPMKGGYTDNYYMQMVQNIRRYKGVRDIPVNHGLNEIKIDGDFTQWSQVAVEYRDTRCDIAHRDHDGYGDNHYVDNSGRNDIVLSKVALDKKNVYFYVETSNELTPASDPNWMLLFIDIDQNAKTGCNGYDYMVVSAPEGKSEVLEYNRKKGCWSKSVCQAAYASGKNQIELAVPRKAIGLKKGKTVSFDFKWSDNAADRDDIISIATTGDTAPNRRFNYRFIWK